MDEEDNFAVWLADGMLRADDDEFAAESLGQLFEEAKSSSDFSAKLEAAASQDVRPGDFGMEFIGPLLPILFVELGRMVWQSYSKALVDKGGKALADLTVEKVKSLFVAKLKTPEGMSEAEQQLHSIAITSGLNAEQADKLIVTLNNPRLAETLIAP